MRTVFTHLLWANPKIFANSPEQSFYDYHVTLFNASVARYNENNTLFGLIKANIILQGLENKRILDDAVKLYSLDSLKSPILIKTLFSTMPYFEFEGTKIYIPTYDPEINRRYQEELYSLKSFPYDSLVKDNPSFIIDPFEYYHLLPFDSVFTRLVKLRSHDEDSHAFYHPELSTILVINDQGGQQAEITIFDDRLKDKDEDGLLDRIENAMDYYFKNDMDGLLKALVSNKLISKALYDELKEIEAEKNLR